METLKKCVVLYKAGDLRERKDFDTFDDAMLEAGHWALCGKPVHVITELGTTITLEIR